MKVTVEIRDADYWRLANIADTRGIKVSDMLRAGIAQVVTAASTPRDTVQMLVLAGLPDGEISKRTGMTVATIADHRRKLGLPPNRRALWEKNQAAKAAERKSAA